jgi:tetratricopeptide (TPR) repeat protein
MLDCQLYGLKAGGHHLTNVLLHAAAAVLLLLVLLRMTHALWPSAWVTAVFAIHPLRVESVAWVAERKDVLSGLFFMLILWFYARYTERPASWGRYLLVVASFALGLTAKPMLVTLPFVLLLLDYWPLGRMRGAGEERKGEREKGSRGEGENLAGSLSPLLPCSPAPFQFPVPTSFPRLFVEKIPLFVLAAASCLVTLAAQRGALWSLEQVAFPWRVANAAVAYVAYLGKMLCPVALAVPYPLPKDPPPAWGVFAAVAVLLAISTAAFVVRRRCPCLLFGWLWYLGTLVPVIGLVQVGSQAMADRYTYLAQIGLYMAIAWGAAHVAGSWPSRRWPLAAVSALVLAGLMVCAWQQTQFWRDSETLWTHTLACTSNNLTAHNNLGNVLAGREQFEEAMSEYCKALEIKPDDAKTYINLGFVLANRGRIDEAIACYRKALEIKPDYAEGLNNLGNALAGRRQFDEAISQYRKALESEPDYAEAHINLGLALAGRGQTDEAIACYWRALEIKPDCAEAHYNLGIALAGRGQSDEAIAHYRQALEIKPDYAEAHVNLGLALAGCGQTDEAIGHYRQALETKPDCAEAHYNLGLTLAGCGQFDEAIAHFRKALEIQPDHRKAHNNLGLVLANRGQIGEAIFHFRKALEIKPDYVEAHNNLGLALAGRGQFDEAVVHYRKALEIKPDDAGTHYNLGLALASSGRLDEALQQYQKALGLASARNDRALGDVIRAEIKRLQSARGR